MKQVRSTPVRQRLLGVSSKDPEPAKLVTQTAVDQASVQIFDHIQVSRAQVPHPLLAHPRTLFREELPRDGLLEIGGESGRVRRKEDQRVVPPADRRMLLSVPRGIIIGRLLGLCIVRPSGKSSLRYVPPESAMIV